jgi:hypothetical protein
MNLIIKNYFYSPISSAFNLQREREDGKEKIIAAAASAAATTIATKDQQQ